MIVKKSMKLLLQPLLVFVAFVVVVVAKAFFDFVIVEKEVKQIQKSVRHIGTHPTQSK
jgi:hypothetical protein